MRWILDVDPHETPPPLKSRMKDQMEKMGSGEVTVLWACDRWHHCRRRVGEDGSR